MGWYEQTPERSLDLIRRCHLGKDEPILDVGVGASTLVDALLKEGFTDIVGVDISRVGLDKLAARLADEGRDRVRLIVDDITHPKDMLEVGPVSLWHDRAVLHFLLDDAQTRAYADTLRAMVREGGYVIISIFKKGGAKMCSGLNIKNYDHLMIQDLLGKDFTMLEHFDHLYHTPRGSPRPYLYTLSQRTGSSGR